MEFYTRDLRKLELDTCSELIIGNGCFSDVYKNDDTAIKLYTEWANWTKSTLMTERKFNVLSSIKSDNYIELHDLFMKVDSHNPKEYIRKNGFSIDGYTAKYYVKDETNPMFKPSSYFISNIEGFEELVEQFVKKRIKLGDINVENTVLTENKIVLIDPDFYEIASGSKKKLRIANTYEIFWLIKLIMYTYSGELQNTAIKYFDEFKEQSVFEGLKEVKRELSRVRTPIEIFEKRA